MDAIETELRIGPRDPRNRAARVARDADSEKGGYLPHLLAQLDPVLVSMPQGTGPAPELGLTAMAARTASA